MMRGWRAIVCNYPKECLIWPMRWRNCSEKHSRGRGSQLTSSVAGADIITRPCTTSWALALPIPTAIGPTVPWKIVICRLSSCPSEIVIRASVSAIANLSPITWPRWKMWSRWPGCSSFHECQSLTDWKYWAGPRNSLVLFWTQLVTRANNSMNFEYNWLNIPDTIHVDTENAYNSLKLIVARALVWSREKFVKDTLVKTSL